jgi:NAD(P)-dependent dehydrogenase (short-subunit alcohol dehydrogenase family)
MTTKSYNRIDCLVLNAGINAHFEFKDIANIEIFNKLMDTNFYANVNLTRLALPYLKTCNGKVVVISSLSGKFGLPSRTAYCASKFALTGFF